MTALNRLRQSLTTLRYSGLRPDALAGLERQEKLLLPKVQRGGTIRPNIDVVISAVKQFVQTRKLHTSKEALLVSHGCAQSIDNGYRLIEDPNLFSTFLDEVNDFVSHKPTFRDCYQQLLKTYLGYHPDDEGSRPAGRPNWTHLRSWLEGHGFEVPENQGAVRLWVQELQRNPQLFSDDPAAIFGKQVLDGDEAAFLRFREALEIDDNSWLIRQLVLAQVKSATENGVSDIAFKAYLPKLFNLLQPLGSPGGGLFDTGLSRILRRYQQCRPPEVHPDLRDFSVRHWGNPWLRNTDGGWVVVDKAERDMVSSWLMLHFIQHFFGVLAQEGGHDKRRLKFWEKYHDSLLHVSFALGADTRARRDRDMVTIRAKMNGLLFKLQGGVSSNNAFIMHFRDWVVVEFGQTGNACFIYESNDLPFELNADVTTVDLKSLDETKSIRRLGPKRLRHGDTRDGTWERSFERELESRGIRPSSENGLKAVGGSVNRSKPVVADLERVHTRTTSASTSATQARVTSYSNGQPKPHIRLRSEAPADTPFAEIDEQWLRQQCVKFGVKTKDFRAENGNLWVYADEVRPQPLVEKLAGWGFQYKSGKGWWKNNGT